MTTQRNYIEEYRSLLKKQIWRMRVTGFVFGWGSERVQRATNKNLHEEYEFGERFDKENPGKKRFYLDTRNCNLGAKKFGLEVRASLAQYS